MFDVRYYIQAENEIKARQHANRAKLEARQREIEKKIPAYTELRGVVASTWGKIVQSAMAGFGSVDGVDDSVNMDIRLEKIQAENLSATQKIRDLLLQAGYPSDYLNTIYTCETCRDTGLDGNSYCQCYRDTVKRLAGEALNAMSPLTVTGFESFDLGLYPDAGIDGVTPPSVTVRELMRKNLELCKSYAEEFHVPDFSGVNGLLLSGKTGLGKTHLSLAVVGKVLSRGFNAVYGSAPDLFRKIETEHFGRENSGTMDSLQAAELLIIDDIGAEFESKFYISQFYSLLNARINRGYPTIVNTNFSMAELSQRYGERIVSRFLTMKILKFYGNDIRQIKRNV